MDKADIAVADSEEITVNFEGIADNSRGSVGIAVDSIDIAADLGTAAAIRNSIRDEPAVESPYMKDHILQITVEASADSSC